MIKSVIRNYWRKRGISSTAIATSIAIVASIIIVIAIVHTILLQHEFRSPLRVKLINLRLRNSTDTCNITLIILVYNNSTRPDRIVRINIRVDRIYCISSLNASIPPGGIKLLQVTSWKLVEAHVISGPSLKKELLLTIYTERHGPIVYRIKVNKSIITTPRIT